VAHADGTAPGAGGHPKCRMCPVARRFYDGDALAAHLSQVGRAREGAVCGGGGARRGGARGVALMECVQEHFACHVCAAAVGENPCEVARPSDASPAPPAPCLYVAFPPQRPDPIPAGQVGQADQSGGGRQLFYADYPQLQAHFRAAHFPCEDPSCEARRPPPGRPRRCSASVSLSPTAPSGSTGPLHRPARLRRASARARGARRRRRAAP
jgi:hypothetical protein